MDESVPKGTASLTVTAVLSFAPRPAADKRPNVLGA